MDIINKSIYVFSNQSYCRRNISQRFLIFNIGSRIISLAIPEAISRNLCFTFAGLNRNKRGRLNIQRSVNRNKEPFHDTTKERHIKEFTHCLTHYCITSSF